MEPWERRMRRAAGAEGRGEVGGAGSRARAGWQAERGGTGRARSGGGFAAHRTFVGGRSRAVSDLFFFLLGGGEKYTREGTGGLNRAGWVFFRLLIVCVCVLLGWVGFFVGFLFLQRSVVCVKHKLIPEPVFSSAAAKRLCRLEQFDTHGSCARRFPPFLQLVEFKGGAGGEKRLPHCCRPIPRTLTSLPAPPPQPQSTI